MRITSFGGPMATAATELTLKHRKLLRVTPRELAGLTDGVRFVETGAQSQRLSRSRSPSVIISASGMATGGRVLHHLKALAPEPRHALVSPASRSPARAARSLAAREAPFAVLAASVVNSASRAGVAWASGGATYGARVAAALAASRAAAALGLLAAAQLQTLPA